MACAAALSGRAGQAMAALSVGVAVAGCAWGATRVASTQPVPITRSAQVHGVVAIDAPPSVSPYGVRARVVAQRLTGDRAPSPGTRLLLDLPAGAGVPDVGVLVRVSGSVGPAASRDAPDWWMSWLRRQRIAGRMRSAGWAAVGVRDGSVGARDALRRWAGANVAAGLSGDVAAVVRGMALGGGAGLSDEAAQRMRDAGLWHLLAVSGQNVAVVGIGVTALLGFAGMARRPRLVASGVVMCAYCLACDGGASVARAGLMGAMALMADMGGAARSRWYALLLALAVLLAFDPLSIGDPGLQLSFAAVVGLFLITPPLASWLRGWLPGRAADLMGQSAGAGLATAPVLAAGFGSLSLVGLAANLVAVPVAGPVVVVALAGTAAHSAWAPVGVAISWVAALGARVVMAVASVASAVPGAVATVPAWSAVPLALVAATPACVWAWLRRCPQVPGLPIRRPPGMGPVLAGAGVLVMVVLMPGVPGCGGPPVLPAGPGMRVLDVGQGAATLLRDGARGSVLVDAGPPGSPAPVIDALARAGVESVGALIITHGAMDHAGGVPALLASIPVGRVVLPIPDRNSPLVRDAARRAADGGIPVDWATAGSGITAGSWQVSVVGPGAAASRSAQPNDRSLVAVAHVEGLTAILPADAESNVLRGLHLPRADVLQVPHHGSADPGLPAILGEVRPGVAVVSVGRGNTYGHPVPGTLAALGRIGARVVRTDRAGDVDVRPADGGVIVTPG